MPLRLTPLEHFLAATNIIPTPMLDMPLGPGVAKVLVTACESGVFDALSRGPATVCELARQLACSEDGIRLLLELLRSMGYVARSREHYRNKRIATRWLVSDSPISIAPYIVHSPDIVAIWDHLPEVVRDYSQVMRMPYEEDASVATTQMALSRHYAGLAALATALGGEVVRRVRLPKNALRLLDVGGSHAGYSVLFCRKYAHLRATILDLPVGIEAGKRTVKQVAMEGRVDFTCSDIVQDDFPQQFSEPFDVALYFHIAHLLQPQINQAVLLKVARTLRPGGMLVFVDQVTDHTRGSNLTSLMVQLMTLTMTTVGGTCYPFPVVKTWLEQAGMMQVRRHYLFTPGATLITAIKR